MFIKCACCKIYICLGCLHEIITLKVFSFTHYCWLKNENGCCTSSALLPHHHHWHTLTVPPPPKTKTGFGWYSASPVFSLAVYDCYGKEQIITSHLWIVNHSYCIRLCKQVPVCWTKHFLLLTILDLKLQHVPLKYEQHTARTPNRINIIVKT